MINQSIAAKWPRSMIVILLMWMHGGEDGGRGVYTMRARVPDASFHGGCHSQLGETEEIVIPKLWRHHYRRPAFQACLGSCGYYCGETNAPRYTFHSCETETTPCPWAELGNCSVFTGIRLLLSPIQGLEKRIYG
jgi:hypothetical protein